MIRVRVGDLQIAALQCHTDAFEDPDPEDAMPATLTGHVLAFDPADRDRLFAFVTAAANSADAQLERDHDPADRRMRDALGNLASRILRAA